MKFDQFFALAKEKGISESQIQITKSKSLSMSLFHHEMDNYNIADGQSVIACGVVNGKFGSCRTEELDSTTFDYLINGIVDSANASEKAEKAELFAGSEKYHKKNVFNKDLAGIPVEKKIALIHEVEDGLFAYDKRISEVESVSYEEREGVSEFYNSRGLKLKQKSNYFIIVAGVNGKDGQEMKTAWDIALGNDLSTFDPKAFVKGIGEKLLAKFGGVQCLSGKYPTILQNDVFADLVNYFVSSASADEIQRQSSFLIGKLNTKIASSKLNIAERPLAKNVFFTYFDDEGVATMNKDIVKKGVLKTYLYNRETAKKDGVVSTGNGQWDGDKIGIGYGNIFIKGSKKSFEEMIAPIKEGVFITEIAGLGTGMNAQSGDFSCQAQGFMIRGGKMAEPLNLITLSGNLLKMLEDIKGFDNHMKLNTDSTECSDVYIKSMAIGGK
jgi:PmbA protein